jgi:hypothetical protein
MRGRDERGDLRRETLDPSEVEGAPKRSKAQESKSFRPELIAWGQEGDGWRGRFSSRWSAGIKLYEVWSESARAAEDKETYFRPSCWRKALKGKAQERWEVKETSKGQRG